MKFLDTLYIWRIVGQDLSNKLCCFDKIRQLAYAGYSDNFRGSKRGQKPRSPTKNARTLTNKEFERF